MVRYPRVKHLLFIALTVCHKNTPENTAREKNARYGRVRTHVSLDIDSVREDGLVAEDAIEDSHSPVRMVEKFPGQEANQPQGKA
jgi:hypothetical protein